MKKCNEILKEALLDEVEAAIRKKMSGKLDDKQIEEQIQFMRSDNMSSMLSEL